MVSIPKQGSAIGRVLAGRYRVEDVLGRGAMGSVYRAVDQESNRVCAIKLMHQFATLDDRAYLRFVHEAQIVAQLYHPNIVEVWGFDRDEDGTPILAMELLRGQDLHSFLIGEGRLPLPRVLEILRAVGGALHAAHSAGVLHRDIKPKNIFLSRQKNSKGEEIEVVKVVDFGLSKVLGMHHANETAPGTILGTAEYVAPETTLGMPELIDFRADQWALGVVAYRLLAGRLPFDGSDVISLLLNIRQAQPRPLRQLVSGIPEHVLAAVERTMAKNKDERFDSVQDFLRALDGLPPVGHLLSKSSDGVPPVHMAGGSLTDLGRISISGAIQAPASATSGRLSPSSLSGRMAGSASSGRYAPSSMSGRRAGSSSGRMAPPSTVESANSSANRSGASLSSSDELAKMSQPAARQDLKSVDPGPEPSADYSVHVSGHLVSGGRHALSDTEPAQGRRLWPIILVSALLLLLGGGIWLARSSKFVRNPSALLPSPSRPLPTSLPGPNKPAPISTAPALLPLAPSAPKIASPTGVSLPPAVSAPPPVPVPVSDSKSPGSGPVETPPAPLVKAPASKPSPAPALSNKGTHVNSTAKPGNSARPAHSTSRGLAAPARLAPAPTSPNTPAGTSAAAQKNEGQSKPAALTPPASPPKESDAPKRITVVD